MAVITAGQASSDSKCAGTFQEASVTPVAPGTKTTSQIRGKKPSQNPAKHLETCQELTKSTTTQSHMYPTIHPSQNPTKDSTG
jgi:hypothetical protein